jgi:hypothetical protein
MHDKFFKTLFEFNEDNYILVWTFNKDNTKESHWFKDYKQAAAFIKTLPAIDVYVGVGLSPKDYGPHARCLQKDIIGIPALWIDIDIQDAVHKKPNLPGSIKEAMKLFDWLEQKPTMIVNSGHGLQAWWVFNEPWTFDAESEHSDAASLAKRFVYGFKLHAAKYNWDVDSVHNLDRVLRVPGTMNCKSKLVPVELIECNDLRYNPSDFEDTLPQIDEKDYESTVKGELILDPAAGPPFDKFEALKAIEQKFALSWEHKRKDLQDQSASSYDLALANYMAMAGWSEQEMADTLIAHRRNHGEDLKLRQDYYRRTISIALKNSEKYRAEEEIMQLSALDPEEQQNIPPERREALLQSLSAMFGTRMMQIIKYTTDPPAYRLITDTGSIGLGDVESLIGQGKLRAKLAAATGKYLPRFKPDRWDSIAQQLLNCCVEQDLGEEATEKGQASSWLEQYLGDKPVMENAETAMVSGDPFRQDGVTYIFGPDFRKWIRVVHMEKVSPKQLGSMLRAIGAEPEVLRIEMEAGRTTRSVWRLK